MHCPTCGTPSVPPRDDAYHFTESGLDWVYLIGVEHGCCTACGDDVVVLPYPEQLLDLITRIVLERKGSLHGKEIRFLRSLIGWTQERLGAEIGRGRVMVARWEAGDAQIVPQTDLILRVVWLRAFLAQRRDEGSGILTGATLEGLTERIYRIGTSVEEMRLAPPGPEPISIDVATRQVTRDCA
jgi:transcriptional regulator with XRE-family HTH domain